MRFAKCVLSLQRVKFLTARQKYEKKTRCANVEQSKKSIMQTIIRTRIDAKGMMHIEHTGRPIDFHAVRDLLQNLQKEVSVALEEVSKDIPDETELCIHGIETVEELLDGIKDHILPCHVRTSDRDFYRGIIDVDTVKKKI